MKRAAIVLLFVLLASGLQAQDFDSAWDAPSEPAISAEVGGEIAVELSPYVHDFKKKGDAQQISLWDMVSASLNFKVEGGNVMAYAAFNLNADSISELWDASPNLSDPTYTPLILDEAYLRGYMGMVNIEAGLRKLTWGKADSLGPLDVTNPIDYTDLRSMSDIQSVKIARPMVHATWNMNGFSKLEAVFIPNFAGHRFAQDGRWASSQFRDMQSIVQKGITSRVMEKYGSFLADPGTYTLFAGVQNELLDHFGNDPVSFPDTGGLDYFQSGLRFTTTLGPADIGLQYFYGNLFRPNFTIAGIDDFFDDLIVGNYPLDPSDIYPGNPDLLSPQLKYNRYHQAGIDYAQVLFDFNIRAEFAVHFTPDMKGTDGSVRNPFIGWSFGFDRYLFWGITANVQCNETVRLFDNKVGKNPVLDSEAGTDAISTRLTMQVSKKFFMDILETKVTALWNIETSDCYIIPALVWTEGDLSTELSAGIFAGEKSGELGQYWKNSFVRIAVKYSF